MRRRFLKTAAATALLPFLGRAAAAAGPTFDAAGFKAAQAADKPILVAVHADWCPNCAKQKPILARLEADPEFREMAFFTIDFDAEKPLVRQFGVRMQSTLIVFRGTTERARSTGATSPEAIKALLEQGLA